MAGRLNMRFLQLVRKKPQNFFSLTSSAPHFSTDTSGSENDGILFEGNSTPDTLHVPVMKDEILQIMQPQDNQTIVDMTFGAGGHSKAVHEFAPGSKLFVLDRDPTAYCIAKELSVKMPNMTAILGRFSELAELADNGPIDRESADAVLFDLGASSMQFDEAHRGFRLSADGPLDMRMDGDRFPNMPTAADVVNTLDERDLYSIIKKYGEEKEARNIARAIINSRYAFGDITTTGQLTKVVLSAFYDGAQRRDKLQRHSHVATKTFQALRIFVNNELNELNRGLRFAHKLLRPGGKCFVISFHSLEDRLVKQYFKERQESNTDLKVKGHSSGYLLKHDLQMFNKFKWEDLMYLEPTKEEVYTNPRARSAKLRVATKSF